MLREPKTCKICLNKKLICLYRKIHYCLENSTNLLVKKYIIAMVVCGAEGNGDSCN